MLGPFLYVIQSLIPSYMGAFGQSMAAHYGKFVAYFRVSTDRQGKSGLGLEAQRESVLNYLDGGRWTLIAEFTEIESGKRNDRPELRRLSRPARNREPSW
jgi:DNA invertase Pin-like site-specific DNA recombinase